MAFDPTSPYVSRNIGGRPFAHVVTTVSAGDAEQDGSVGTALIPVVGVDMATEGLGAYTPKGYQQITSLSTSVSLTVPAGAKYAMIYAENRNVRWRDDGIDPTASVGMQLLAGNGLWYDGDLAEIEFIEEAASAKLNVSYYA